MKTARQHDPETRTDRSASSSVRRYVLRPCIAPPAQTEPTPLLAPGQTILLAGRQSALSAALREKLTEEGYRVCGALPDEGSEVNGASVDALAALHRLHEGESIGMILNVAGWTGERENSRISEVKESQLLLALLQHCERDLKKASGKGGGAIVNLTAMDGRFGLSGGDAVPLGAAGTLGVAKTAAREWPEVRVKCIDLDPAMNSDTCADRVLAEIRAGDPITEVGFTQEGRWRLDLVERAASPPVPLPLDARSVFLVTGGAYGITAEVTTALLGQYHGHVILVGRSPLPEPEAPEIQGIDDTETLRRTLIEEMNRNGSAHVRPADVERRLERIIKDRQIRSTLAALRKVSASVAYHSLDVRDASALGDLIDDIYAKRGRIDGVIHGAGIIEDKLIRDKRLDSFARVFETKVIPARVLAAKLKPDGLRFVAFFGSVAARFGNAGQADYSAANEELNKIAQSLSRKWRNVHVVSLNWGPWNHGMTSGGLRRLLSARGIRLIPVEQGVRFFLEELGQGNGEVEVIVTDSLQEIAGARISA